MNQPWVYICGFLGGSVVKNLPADAGDVKFDPLVRKIPWRRKWQPTPVFLPGKSHRQRSLVGYSPWGRKSESVSEVTQSCSTVCNPMECSLPSSSVHGIFQARILEWVAISFSKRSSRPRDWIQVSCIAGFTVAKSQRKLTDWTTNNSKMKTGWNAQQIGPSQRGWPRGLCWSLEG